MAQCHCKDCQRVSGTGHTSLAFFMEGQISIDGKFSEYSSVADSGNENIRGFCPACGLAYLHATRPEPKFWR